VGVAASGGGDRGGGVDDTDGFPSSSASQTGRADEGAEAKIADDAEPTITFAAAKQKFSETFWEEVGNNPGGVPFLRKMNEDGPPVPSNEPTRGHGQNTADPSTSADDVNAGASTSASSSAVGKTLKLSFWQQCTLGGLVVGRAPPCTLHHPYIMHSSVCASLHIPTSVATRLVRQHPAPLKIQVLDLPTTSQRLEGTSGVLPCASGALTAASSGVCVKVPGRGGVDGDMGVGHRTLAHGVVGGAAPARPGLEPRAGVVGEGTSRAGFPNTHVPVPIPQPPPPTPGA